MKMVYICSPLRGDIDANISHANAYCAWAATKGVVPLAPHTIFTNYLDDNDAADRQHGMSMGMELLSRCQELWVCGCRISEGMQLEINMAAKLGIPTIRILSRQIQQ